MPRVSRQRAFVAAVATDLTVIAGDVRHEADRRYRQQVALAKHRRASDLSFAAHLSAYAEVLRERAHRDDYPDITLDDVRRRVAAAQTQDAQPSHRLRVLSGEPA